MDHILAFVDLIYAAVHSAMASMHALAKGLAEKAESSGGALSLAVVTALIGLLGYLGKLFVQALASWWEERKKYRSSLIRYVYDVDIWRRDFFKRFGETEAGRLRDKLIEGGDTFKFSFGSSKDADSRDIMAYIHWLRPREIYTTRLFLAYSEMFDSMCVLISSDAFSGFEQKRKIDGFVKTLEIGLDTYYYAGLSLSEIQKPKKSGVSVFFSSIGNGFSRIILATRRDYLDSPISELQEFIPVLEANAVPGEWTRDKLKAFRADTEARLQTILDERGKRLGHDHSFRFFPFRLR